MRQLIEFPAAEFSSSQFTLAADNIAGVMPDEDSDGTLIYVMGDSQPFSTRLPYEKVMVLWKNAITAQSGF